jgi:hypothetical protein
MERKAKPFKKPLTILFDIVVVIPPKLPYGFEMFLIFG